MSKSSLTCKAAVCYDGVNDQIVAQLPSKIVRKISKAAPSDTRDLSFFDINKPRIESPDLKPEHLNQVINVELAPVVKRSTDYTATWACSATLEGIGKGEVMVGSEVLDTDSNSLAKDSTNDLCMILAFGIIALTCLILFG